MSPHHSIIVSHFTDQRIEAPKLKLKSGCFFLELEIKKCVKVIAIGLKKKSENRNLKHSERCFKYINQVCSTASVLLLVTPMALP